MEKVYDLWVSGGKDSIVASLIALSKAKSEGAKYRIVFIDEISAFQIPDRRILPHDPLIYVSAFSKSINAELVILRPAFNYWDGVKRWGYPLIFHDRWCKKYLKDEPTKRFALDEYKQNYKPVWVLGIRRNESDRRKEIYKNIKEYEWKKVNHVWVKYWYPILTWDDEQVNQFIKEHNIPKNPLWSFGHSLECLCFAGTSYQKFVKIINSSQELSKFLYEKDKEVQSKRRSNTPAFICPLLQKRIPLYKYIENLQKQEKLLVMDNE